MAKTRISTAAAKKKKDAGAKSASAMAAKTKKEEKKRKTNKLSVPAKRQKKRNRSANDRMADELVLEKTPQRLLHEFVHTPGECKDVKLYLRQKFLDWFTPSLWYNREQTDEFKSLGESDVRHNCFYFVCFTH